MSAHNSSDETSPTVDSEHITPEDGHHTLQKAKPKDIEDAELLEYRSGCPTCSASQHGAAALAQENDTSDDNPTGHDARSGGSRPNTGIPRHQPSLPGPKLRSIYDSLKEHIPENSGSVFASKIYRARSSRAVLISTAGRLNISTPYDNSFVNQTNDNILSALDDVKPGEHAVLIIQDIDQTLYDALQTRYSNAIWEAFFLSHLLGHDVYKMWWGEVVMSKKGSPLSYRPEIRRTSSTPSQFEKDYRFMMRLLEDLVLASDAKEDVGFHVRCWPESQGIWGPEVVSTRLELLKTLGFEQYLCITNNLVSCCRLSKQIYLVLQNKILDDLEKLAAPAPRHGSREWHIALRDSYSWEPAILPIDSELRCSRLGLAVIRVFEEYPVQSVLVSKQGHGDGGSGANKALDGRRFKVLLILSYWQGLIETQEESLMRLQQLAASEDDAKAFSALTKFRRGLAPYPLYLDKLRSYLDSRKLSELDCANDGEHGAEDDDGINEAAAQGTDMPEPERLMRSLETPQKRSRPIDLTTLVPRELKEFDDRLKALREVLNDEIQVTIGSVQVRDAQIMRKQTQVTVDQTTWTVVLALLAAIYLSLTLVTGIFGMNLSEITLTEGAPDGRMAFGAWAVITIITVAGLWMLYVAVRKLQSRRGDLDLEAGHGTKED